MGIRSTAKAVVIEEGKILLTKCRDAYHGDYYSFPGGGQEPYETLAETLVRECLEETGYPVIPGRFIGLLEVIFDNPDYRRQYPDYCHRMFHYFQCSLAESGKREPTDKDTSQIDIEWVPLHALGSIPILPKAVGDNLCAALAGEGAVFFGSEHQYDSHA